MKSGRRATPYVLIWIFVGVSMIVVGLLFHNGPGWLSLSVGLLITLATPYVWSTVTLWKADPTLQSPNLSDENETEELFERVHKPVQQVGDQSSPESAPLNAMLSAQPKD